VFDERNSIFKTDFSFKIETFPLFADLHRGFYLKEYQFLEITFTHNSGNYNLFDIDLKLIPEIKACSFDTRMQEK
jgi:hypothetical protein